MDLIERIWTHDTMTKSHLAYMPIIMFINSLKTDARCFNYLFDKIHITKTP